MTGAPLATRTPWVVPISCLVAAGLILTIAGALHVGRRVNPIVIDDQEGSPP